jgi:hypothetical protein
MQGNYQVASQLVASRVVLSSVVALDGNPEPDLVVSK